MAIAPWFKRFFDGPSKCDEVIERSAARTVIASNGRLRQVPMTMTACIVALAVQRCVLGIRERGRMQSMRRIEWHLQSQKNYVVLPCFCKKIVSFVQPNAPQWNHSAHPFIDVSHQTLGRDGTIL